MSDSVIFFVFLRISIVFPGAQEGELPIELEVHNFWWCLPWTSVMGKCTQLINLHYPLSNIHYPLSTYLYPFFGN